MPTDKREIIFSVDFVNENWITYAPFTFTLIFPFEIRAQITFILLKA